MLPIHFFPVLASAGLATTMPAMYTWNARQPEPIAQTPAIPAPTPTPVIDELKDEAAALAPLVNTGLARAFLEAVPSLPEPGARDIYRAKEGGRPISPDDFTALPPEGQEAFVRRQYNARFFYHTGYGTPLMYARALDLLAAHDKSWTADSLADRRILDFGCGTIGHLRLLAANGADVTGVDVEPLFKILYGQPGDQGPFADPAGKKGNVRLLTGRWPAGEAIVTDVKTGGPYDLFISKNTLKRGYIHPAREADPSRLVDLGVDDDAFIKAVYDTLKPGGVFLIYNIAPAQAPADKPYLPHADGQCPFDRAELEKAGFEVVVYDEDDQATILKYWESLGLNQGKDEERMKSELFAWWTMCRRPVKGTAPGQHTEPPTR
jgi:SAM-dependent methyltransferase